MRGNLITGVGKWPERCSEFLLSLCCHVWTVFTKPRSYSHDEPFPLTNFLVQGESFSQRISPREFALLPHVDFQWKPRN